MLASESHLVDVDAILEGGRKRGKHAQARKGDGSLFRGRPFTVESGQKQGEENGTGTFDAQPRRSGGKNGTGTVDAQPRRSESGR